MKYIRFEIFLFSIFAFILGFGITFLSMRNTDNTTYVSADYRNQAAENAEIIANKKDSIRILLSEIRIRDAAILNLEDKIRISKKTYDAAKQNYSLSTNTTAECDTIIQICDSIIDLQTAKIACH